MAGDDVSRVTEPSPPAGRRLVAETAAVVAVALGWICLLLRIWSMPMRLPFDTRSDGTLISAMVKTIGERGWYLHQPRLGAPFGQQFYDFPHGGETFQLLIIKVLVMITHDWGLAINLYFIGGFGLLAGITFVVLRVMRFGPVVAGVAALIYSFMPYHFAHGEMHLWRSDYYTVPLACLLLVWLTAWREHFLVDPGHTGRGTIRGNLRWRRVGVAVVIAVVIGGSETMVTAFTVSLVASAAIVAAVRWREPHRLVLPAVVVGVIGATFLVLSFPTLNYYAAHGTNTAAARRLVTESELYSLKITRLVMPQGGHRFKPLSDLGNFAEKGSFVPSEGGQALGILGTAGFVGALYGALAGRRRRTRPDTRPFWDRSLLREEVSTITVLSLLFGTVGGFGVVLAMVGFSQVRVWDRILLFIAFFAAVVVCGWSEGFTAWVHGRFARATLVLAATAVAVLAFGLWDGIPPVRQSYDKTEAQYASDRSFLASIEHVMPAGTSIFQLPVMVFPEAIPPGNMQDYDPLRGYLADNGTFRWSYGAIKGRPDADWQVYLRDHIGPVGALPALLGMGFTGIWLDTFGYTDGGAEARAIQAAVGVAPLVSSDHRFLFFDLRDFKRRVNLTPAQLRASTVRILHIQPPPGAP